MLMNDESEPRLDLRYWQGIYCDNCRGVRRCILDVLTADSRNEHEAMDLVCSGCNLIVATLHQRAQ